MFTVKLLRHPKFYTAIGIPLASLMLGVGFNLIDKPAFAQLIPESHPTQTQVIPDGQIWQIQGGQLSGDGTNLFHSFQEFNLFQGETANFLTTPQIQRIFSRVTGTQTSWIDGLIQVTGGNSHLFLINPAGIIFGPHARLNVPGSFTVTTASGVQFGNHQWFETFGEANWSSLVGSPTGFRFDPSQVGTIINQGNLTVAPGQALTLAGGSIINQGTLSAPGGQLTLMALPDGEMRISQAGHLLSLEIIHPSGDTFNPLELPELLTGYSEKTATRVIQTSTGNFQLTAPNLGTIIVENSALTADNLTIDARHNLELIGTQIHATGSLHLQADNTLRIRDSYEQAFLAKADENLTLQGEQFLDIIALNQPDHRGLEAGSNLTLISQGLISLDTHLSTGGTLNLLNRAGEVTNFQSLFDPIITAIGDVRFGNYTGPSLKIETRGGIFGGDIEIQPAIYSGEIIRKT